MAVSRESVLSKSNGHCWYCGDPLKGKKWHQDHFHPVIRHDNKPLYPELDCFDNLVPSCIQCNNFKSSSSIEGYRSDISSQFELALKNSNGLRQLNRLGLVELSSKPVIFWFEEQGFTVPDEYTFYGISEEAMSTIWTEDKFEESKYFCTGKYTVSARSRLDGRSGLFLIATDHDWNQKRTDIVGSRFMYERAAEWGLRLAN